MIQGDQVEEDRVRLASAHKYRESDEL